MVVADYLALQARETLRDVKTSIKRFRVGFNRRSKCGVDAHHGDVCGSGGPGVRDIQHFAMVENTNNPCVAPNPYLDWRTNSSLVWGHREIPGLLSDFLKQMGYHCTLPIVVAVSIYWA